MSYDKHKRQLNKIVKLIPDNQQPMARSIANELGFIMHTLDQLKDHVAEHGAIDLFKNGRQEMWRESPAMKTYNTTIQRYSVLTKQLLDLVPVEQAKEKEVSAILDFINDD